MSERRRLGRILDEKKKIAYVLSSEDLSIKDILEFESYTFSDDIDYSSKSSIKTAAEPKISEDDFIICKSGSDTVLIGICEKITHESESSGYTVSIKQKENFFSRFVFPDSEEIIRTTGIEDFIAQTIDSGWKSSGDPATDKTYIETKILSHTKVYAKVGSIATLTEGAFNLKTFLGNAQERYGIFTDFEFSAGKLTVSIGKDTAAALTIDTKMTDIAEYKEDYSVDALAKLNVRWIKTESGESGASSVSDISFYLLTDRSVSTDKDSPDRAKGTIRSMIVEAETYEEMRQKVTDTFSGNSYQHKVSVQIRSDSKLYDYTEIYPGRSCTIRTGAGVKTTLVTAREISDSKRTASISFGKLRVSLIEKIRRSI